MVGKFSFQLNGTNLQSANFYADSKERETEKVILGTVDLEPGIQTLKITWEGEKEEGKNLSLDYLKFQRIE